MPEVLINGAEGRLEGRYSPGKGERRPVVLLLHPHPQHGGTMHNKVIYALNQVFIRQGFATLRFNFRGVGRSQGSFGRGEGELTDAASALDWLQSINANASQCWIAGFSFGAWIGMQLLMRRPEIDRFISVAPPANIFDFAFLAPCPSSGLILQGDKDEVVPEESVKKLSEKLGKQRDIEIDYRIIKGANHFFTGKLDKLEAQTEDYIETAMEAPPPVREPREKDVRDKDKEKPAAKAGAREKEKAGAK
jgi:alpha/beta superfamily hydrolase